MAKIQRAYRIEESLIKQMDRIIKKFPKVTYTDIIETALTDLFAQKPDDVERTVAHYVLSGSDDDGDIPFD